VGDTRRTEEDEAASVNAPLFGCATLISVETPLLAQLSLFGVARARQISPAINFYNEGMALGIFHKMPGGVLRSIAKLILGVGRHRTPRTDKARTRNADLTTINNKQSCA
jgi:hypothetical protein